MTKCMPGHPNRWSHRPACPTWRCCAMRRSERPAGLAVCDLCRRYGVEPPAQSGLHFTAELGPFRLKWERHTEFIRFMFIVEGTTGDPFERPAITVLPEDWVAALPGQIMVAAHAALITADHGRSIPHAIGAKWFDGNVPIGAAVSGGAATALTDFRIHADGFSRHLLLDHAPRPGRPAASCSACSRSTPIASWRCWRLPVARAAGPLLAASERELAQITASLVAAEEASEPALLDQLTRLAAEIEHQQSRDPIPVRRRGCLLRADAAADR